MNAAFEIKGHCPGVLTPMVSGDGLLVRVRPRAGMLSRMEADAIAEAATRYGNGFVELTSRANLQLRSVATQDHAKVVAMLSDVGLIDEDAAQEGRRNIIVTPFGQGEGRMRALAIVHALETRLSRIDGLPTKFGFAIDTGVSRVLTNTPADIRIERNTAGVLMVRADGLEFGIAIERSTDSTEAEIVANAAVSLAQWFVESGGARDGVGRMARHVVQGARPPGYDSARDIPVSMASLATPGTIADGVLVAVEFGQLPADVLVALAERCADLRVTPWRMLLLAGVDDMPAFDSLIHSESDPRLKVTACTGAPGCPQAHAPTRDLARRLAPSVPEDTHVHVSGCRKGCAMTKPAPITLVADKDGFMIVRNGDARAAPEQRGVAPERLIDDPSILFGHR